MSISIRPARSEELRDVLDLLERVGLPVAGVGEHFERFAVAKAGDVLLGVVGLEIYGDRGLLRSLAVDHEGRGRGTGTRLVEWILARATERKLKVIYLLTTTAEGYFRRFGFERISREQLDPQLSRSKELQGACPETAVCMVKTPP